ncbi:hypothetical protein DFH28DRAFT_528731 [Melampsora americana]|nr:hypothetical protein DFH28DRAFT_528731 [Melampsora americana]
MKILNNTIILIYTHIIVQWWHLFPPTSAMYLFTPTALDFFDMGEEPALRAVDYHKSWCIHPGSTSPSSKDHLIQYLDMSLEERRNSPPFFFYPPPPHLPHDAPGLDSLELMNKMLQSRIETWPEYIHEILKTDPSCKIKNFWGFMYEISDFMTTPVLQQSLFELCNESEDIKGWVTQKNYGAKEIRSKVIIRYEQKMNEHISLLEDEKYVKLRIQDHFVRMFLICSINTDTYSRPKEVVNIFTINEQEKLGKYKIQLENQWTSSDAVILYKNWASHMKVYMGVQGAVKGALECQAILVSWIKLDTLHSSGYIQVPYGMREAFKDSLFTSSQAVANEFVNSIQSLDEESWFKLWKFQKEFSYGINSRNHWSRKTLVFWAKFMSVYLKMKMRPYTWKWRYLFEAIIEEDTEEDHLETVMQEFSSHSLAFDAQNDWVVEFLQLILNNTKPGRFRRFVEECLKRISNDPNCNLSFKQIANIRFFLV